MGMPEATTRWTREMVLALPDDGNRYELVDGELLVTPPPTPRHQRAVAGLLERLQPYVRRNRLGVLFFSPADIELEPGEVMQPDLFLAPVEGGRGPGEWQDIRSLLLAVEVLSPSTARYDRQIKRRRFQRARVPEYWIVDLDARIVERWRPDDARPEVTSETLIWQLSPSVVPLEIDLPGLFAESLE